MSPGTAVNRVDIGRLNVPGKFITVEAVVTETEATGVNNIVSKHSHPEDVNYVLRTSGFFIRTYRGGGVAKNPVQLCAGKTYHVAGTYDGAQVRYFVNGIQVSSAPCTGNMVQNRFITSIGGMWQTNSNFEQFRGYISEVRIWKVARTAAEIAANMLDLPDPLHQRGLLAYYKFKGSLANLQGDPAFNGKASNSKLATGTDPYFGGALSYSFCGGNASLVQAPPAVEQSLRDGAPSLPALAGSRSATIQKERAAPQDQTSSKKLTEPVVSVANQVKPALAEPDLPKPVSPGRQATIVVWDFDGLDGDTISLKMNGKPLGPPNLHLVEFKSYGSPECTFETELPAGGGNELVITAISEGSLPFATIGVLISDGGRSQRYYIKLHKGERAAVHFVEK